MTVRRLGAISKVKGVSAYQFQVELDGKRRCIKRANRDELERIHQQYEAAMNGAEELPLEHASTNFAARTSSVASIAMSSTVIPDKKDPEFFLVLLKNIAVEIAQNPESDQLRATARTIAQVASAAYRYQDQQELIERFEECEKIIRNYGKAERIGALPTYQCAAPKVVA